MLKDLALLSIAGAVGTLARFGMSGFIQRLCGDRFPWGTVAVNLIGCFLFGLIWSLAQHRSAISVEARFLLLTGFMGAFTTFSTFAFETTELLQASQWWIAAMNIFVQLFFGVLLVILGLAVGRLY